MLLGDGMGEGEGLLLTVVGLEWVGRWWERKGWDETVTPYIRTRWKFAWSFIIHHLQNEILTK